MNTTTTTLTLGRPGLFQGRGLFDWLYALAVVLGAAYAFHRYGVSMDVYEKGILAGATPALIALGWFWGPLRVLALAVGAATLVAIGLYSRTSDGFGADLAAGEKAVRLIRREPDETVARIVAGWPRNFDASRAEGLGFVAEKSFDEIIAAHLEDEPGSIAA